MAKFGSAKFGVDKFGRWARPTNYGNWRILPILEDFIFGRRRPWKYSTVANLLTTVNNMVYTIANSITAESAKTYETVANDFGLNFLWGKGKRMACLITVNKKVRNGIANLASPYIRTSVANTLSDLFIWYGKKKANTFTGFWVHIATPIANLVFPWARIPVANDMGESSSFIVYKAETIANYPGESGN